MPFLHDDGTEVQPLSMKDFMSQGRDKLDKYVLNNEPTNDAEKAYRDNLMSQKVASLKKHLAELDALLPKQTGGTETAL